MDIAPERLDEILTALAEQLRDLGRHVEPVVIGGAALLAVGLVARATKDVDVVALAEGGSLKSADPLPEPLLEARKRVASRRYGPALTVHFAGRLDQIHFKLYAMVDQGGGRHEADLRALSPSREELIESASWTETHDPSPGFREMLEQALTKLGVDDVDDPT